VRLFGPIKRWLATIGECGTATIEFAMVGTSFMMMVLAFEFGYMLFVQAVLDNSARDAARLIRTGQLEGSGSPSTDFQTLLCANVGSMIGCGNIVYQSQTFNSWSSAQTAVNTPPTRDINGNLVSSGFAPGVASQIMVVTVTYNYPFFTSWVGTLFSASLKSAYLSSTVVFQNEPY
jgi:Flp pilus assembly protein TadG